MTGLLNSLSRLANISEEARCQILEALQALTEGERQNMMCGLKETEEGLRAAVLRFLQKMAKSTQFRQEWQATLRYYGGSQLTDPLRFLVARTSLFMPITRACH